MDALSTWMTKAGAAARSIFITKDDAVRWRAVVPLVLVLVLVGAGVMASLLPRSGAGSADANNTAQGSTAGGSTSPSAGTDELVLNPDSMDRTKDGLVPLKTSTNPAVVAEAYVRFMTTVDTSKGSADAFYQAAQQWRTPVLPGLDSLRTEKTTEASERAETLATWHELGSNAQSAGYTTAVHLDAEIAKGNPSARSWVADLTGAGNVHLVEVKFVRAMSQIDSQALKQVEGRAELVVVCPGATGFKGTTCKVMTETETPRNFPGVTLDGWPVK